MKCQLVTAQWIEKVNSFSTLKVIYRESQIVYMPIVTNIIF